MGRVVFLEVGRRGGARLGVVRGSLIDFVGLGLSRDSRFSAV